MVKHSVTRRTDVATRRGDARHRDVSDEDADEDGALLVAGYASLTPLRVPTRTRTGTRRLVHSALEAIARHLNKVR